MDEILTPEQQAPPGPGDATIPPSPEEPTPPMTLLPGIPFPPFVLALAAVTLIAFALGITRLPRALRLGADYERGSRMMEQGDAKGAAKYLKPVVDQYGNALDVKIQLMKAYVQSDDLGGAIDLWRSLEDVYVSKEQSAELDQIASSLDSKLTKKEAKPEVTK